jgi:hypothetical protein
VGYNSIAGHLTMQVTVKRSKVLYIECNGGTDDGLWNDSDEDGNVTSECEEDESNDCEDEDSDTDW